jgi:hypothetical protein
VLKITVVACLALSQIKETPRSRKFKNIKLIDELFGAFCSCSKCLFDVQINTASHKTSVEQANNMLFSASLQLV